MLSFGRVVAGGGGGHVATFSDGLLVNCWRHVYRLTGGIADYWPPVDVSASGRATDPGAVIRSAGTLYLAANQLPPNEAKQAVCHPDRAALRQRAAVLRQPKGAAPLATDRLSTFPAVMPYCDWSDTSGTFYGHWHGANSNYHPTLHTLVVS